MQFSVRVAGRMSADTVTRHTARALGIPGSTAPFISNERWEIEVVASGDAQAGPGVGGSTAWELLCRAVGDQEAAAIDLERVMHALLAGGAWEVVIGMPQPRADRQ